MENGTYDVLAEAKRALMIPDSETFADGEIRLHAEACRHLLISMGVPEDAARSDDPMVRCLIVVYVKTFFGFEADGSVRELPPSFEMLARQLALTSGGNP